MNITRKANKTSRSQKIQKGKVNISIIAASTSVLIAACALIVSYISLSIQDESYDIQKNTALSAYLQAYVHLNPVVDVIPGRDTRFDRGKDLIEWQYHLVNRGDMDITITQNNAKIYLVINNKLIDFAEDKFELVGNLTVGSSSNVHNNINGLNIPKSGVLCVEDEWKSTINSKSLQDLSRIVSRYFENIPKITRTLRVRTAIKLSDGEVEDTAAQFCELLPTDDSHQ